jgi:hypothetical protein
MKLQHGFLALALVLGVGAHSMAAMIAVDIDSTRISGTNTTGAITTQPGYTSWDLTNVLSAGGNNLVVDGVTFDIFGLSANNNSRIRPTGGGGSDNNLLTDFVFNEGAAGRAVGLRISGLPIGQYQMQSWHYDSDAGVAANENFTKVEIRNQGDATTTTLLSKQPFSTSPITFGFDISAAGQVREIIFREDDAATATDPVDQNRARLNAFTLATVPEPASGILALGCLVISTLGASRARVRKSAS